MPTDQDETLPQRYAREHQDYLKLCGSMTAEQVADTQLQLHNSLAREQSLQQRLTAADERADERADVLETALAGMLFAFDDGVGRDWSEDLLDFARKLTTAKEFNTPLKPAEPATDEHVCTGCGAKGWTANCSECVPY